MTTLVPHSEADPFALLLTALVKSSAVVGAGAYVPVSAGGRQPPRLFVVLVGSSARARKGTAEADVGAVFDQAEDEFRRTRTRSGLSSGEGLAQAFTSPDEDGPADTRLLVVEPEFARVLTVASREGNTLSTTLRDLWDRGHTATLTRANPIKVEDAHLALIAHITEDELRAKMRAVEIANGFANRFLIAGVHRSKRLPHGGSLPDVDLSLLAHDWHTAISRARRITGPVHRSTAAAGVWADWYNSLDDDVHGLHGSLVARAEAHVTRLSLLYALLDGSPVIDLCHHAAAVAVWNHCEQTLTMLYPSGETTGNADADRILTAVRERGSLPRTDAYRLFHGHITDDRLDVALGVLTDQAGIVETVEASGGRPRNVIRLDTA